MDLAIVLLTTIILTLSLIPHLKQSFPQIISTLLKLLKSLTKSILVIPNQLEIMKISSILLPHQSIKKQTLLFFLTCLFFISASPVSAQTLSLSVWPPIIDVLLQPGKSISQTYQLKNLGNDTIITTSIVPFQPADEFGHIQLLPQQAPPQYFSIPAPFPLKASQTKNVVLKITIPETAQSTDHYLALLFHADTKSLIKNSGSTITGSIASNILLTISQPNTINHTASIKQFTTAKFLDSFSPIPFTFRLQNTSDNHFKAIGQINIFNSFKKKIATIPFREDNILADSIRQLTTTSSSLDWNSLFPLGKYTATADITPQNSTNSVSQTISFFVFPYKLLIFLSILFTIYLIIKKRKEPNLPCF